MLPIPGTTVIAMANAALEAFVKGQEAEDTAKVYRKLVRDDRSFTINETLP